MNKFNMGKWFVGLIGYLVLIPKNAYAAVESIGAALFVATIFSIPSIILVFLLYYLFKNRLKVYLIINLLLIMSVIIVFIVLMFRQNTENALVVISILAASSTPGILVSTIISISKIRKSKSKILDDLTS